MNTKLALTAIIMFAAIMGISTVAPVIAEPGNAKSKATTEICHFAEEEPVLDEEGNPVLDENGVPVVEPAHWMFLFVSGKGAVQGHINNHGDGINSDFEIVTSDDRDRCDLLVNPPAP